MVKSSISRHPDCENSNFSIVASSIILMLYFITLWKLPFMAGFEWRWPFLLGLSTFLFLILKEQTNPRAAKMFLVFFTLQLLGAYISLFRTNEIGITLYNILGFIINGLVLFLFFHVLLHKLARVLFLAGVIVSSSLWLIEVLIRYHELGDIARTTFVQEGGDKNLLALLFALGATLLFAVINFWKPTYASSKFQVALKTIFLLWIALLFYGTLQLYSRSGLLTFVLSLLGIFVIRAFSEGSRGIILLVVVTVITLIFANSYISGFYQIFPYWEITSQRVLDPELRSEFNSVRLGVLEKGIALISENPIVGVGLGRYKYTSTENASSFLGKAGHNTYLVTWAELGIAGIVAVTYWILNFLAVALGRFSHLDVADKIGVCVIVPYLLMMFTLDLGTSYLLAFVFFASIVASNPYPNLPVRVLKQ